MATDADLDKVYHGIAGFSAGFVSVISLYPLDLIKTRFQAHTFKYSSTWHAIVSIWQREGPRGLYHGCGPSVFSSSVAWGFYFFFYSWIKATIEKGMDDMSIPELAGSSMLCSFLAGTTVQAFTNPLWVFKTNVQLSKNASAPTVLREIYRVRGLRGFWKGFFISLLGITQGAIQFSMYEPLKKHVHITGLTSVDIVVATAISKTIATVCTYPYQVFRTHAQSTEHRTSHSLTQTFQTIRHSHGIGGLYKGLPTCLMRILPQTCITFLVYEGVIRYYKSSLPKRLGKRESSILE